MKLEELFLENDFILTEEMLWEMARIKPKASGLPNVIWISDKKYVNGQHWARIKVSNVIGTFSSTDNFVVTIDKKPKVIAGTCRLSKDSLDDILDWVILNYDALMKYWNDKYDDDADFYAELRKL